MITFSEACDKVKAVLTSGTVDPEGLEDSEAYAIWGGDMDPEFPGGFAIYFVDKTTGEILSFSPMEAQEFLVEMTPINQGGI